MINQEKITVLCVTDKEKYPSIKEKDRDPSRKMGNANIQMIIQDTQMASKHDTETQ